MQQRIIRIGLALMLLVVGIAPGFAAAVKCCCGPKEPEIKAKTCCPTCTCELKADTERRGSPEFVWVPSELEPGLVPQLVKLAVHAVLVQPKVLQAIPEPQGHSPPERVLGRAPPLFCS